MPKRFNYKKLVKDCESWVQSRSGVQDDLDVIEKLTATASTEGECRVLGATLSYMAIWYAHEGVLSVAQGKPEGWAELRRSAHHFFWHIRISCRSYDRLKNKFSACFTPTLSRIAECGLPCMALGSWEEADWLARRLFQSRSDGSIGPWEWPLAVPRLIIALHRYFEGRTDVDDLELGVYKSVFEHWDDPGKLQKTLLELADYHVDNIRGLTKTRVGEFGDSPVNIFPAELVAIRRVRERLGLETPAIDHPLMQTPFADPPRDIPLEPDDLLDRALAKVRTFIPDL